MAKALVKTEYRANVGAYPNQVQFYFGSKLEMKQWLAKARDVTGTAQPVFLLKCTVEWDDSTHLFTATNTSISASDIE